MKRIALVFSLFISSLTFAGGFMFPNVSYDYARVYLFNANEKAETDRPEFSIYRDGVYSYSKIGDGWEFSEQMNVKMNSIFRLGVDMMVAGLSGCYIPRHGIIYFDKTGNPVASLSVCFECQRIYFWSSQKHPEFGTKFSEKDVPKAEKQFADLEALFIANGIPVYKKTSDYIDHAAQADSLYKNVGEIIFDYLNVSAFQKNDFSPDDIRSWCNANSGQNLLAEVRDGVLKIEGGDTVKTSHQEYMLAGKDGTVFTFIDENGSGKLISASILNPLIHLPNGISTGMSLDQIQATFLVWDGIAYPSSIIVNYSDATIRYVFEKRTLRRIEVVMI